MKKIILLSMMLIGHLNFAQDTCATALPIDAAGLFVVDGVNGSQVPMPICAPNGSGATAGEWYAYTPSQNYTVTVTSNIVENTPRKDTRVHVYTGSCGSLVCYAGDDDSGSNYSSVVSFNVTAGTTYLIAWDNHWNSAAFTFQLIENEIIVPPPTPITYTTESISTINSSYNICVVDMNNDGLDDIAGISQNNLKVHYQRDNGTFEINNFTVNGTSKMPTWSLAAGDYNRDGFNDLILGAGNGLSVWKSNNVDEGLSYTGFNPTDYIFCQRTNFTDINNDGNLDVFSCHDIAPNCYYLNDGSDNLSFYQATVTPGAMNVGNSGGNYATLFFDYDNDNDSDIFISKCSGPPCELIRNDGNGVYTDISAVAGLNITPIQTWSSAVADFDNDGDMDIIITASSGNHHYFKNNLDTSNNVEETFTEITSGSGWDTNSSNNIDNIAYDFDNDGYVDVLGGGNKIMFNNDGNGTFSPESYSGIAVGAVGDLNDDGYLDILNGNTIRYAVPNGNNWIRVRLKGEQSNANGISARIEIYGAWGKQIRDVRSGEGFKYMSSLFTHFGIGAATEITKVVVKWPSGTVDEILNPTMNQLLTVVENETNLTTLSQNNSSFSITPNPVNDIVTISLQNTLTEVVSAQIIDLNGKVVMKPTVLNNTIDVKSLVTGTYILSIKDKEGKQFSQKLLKK